MKKKIALLLCIIVCASACFACTNKEYIGVYKEEDGEYLTIGTYFLEIKSGGLCEYYLIRLGETKDEAKKGQEFYTGTYEIDDGAITLNINVLTPNGNEIEKWKGTILSNGNIKIDPYDSGAAKTFKKQ